MPTRKIHFADWASTFDALNGQARRRRIAAHLEVVGPSLDAAETAATSDLRSIAYVPQGAFLRLAFDDANYLVAQPREIWLHEDDHGLPTWLLVVGADHSKEIVSLARRRPDPTS